MGGGIGSTLFVLSEDQIRRNVRRFQTAFQAGWPDGPVKVLHDYLFANKTGAPPADKADIVGRSCYGDRLQPTVPILEVQGGDVLALLDTGAYQEVSMSNFNAMPRPATVLVTGSQATVVRGHETEEDVFRRDVLPEHLRGNEGAR